MRGFFRSFSAMKAAHFGKRERLKSRKEIEALFGEGKSFVHAPVRVKYRFLPPVEGAVPVQAGVSVSRKAFKRAVDRNRLKRQLREAYRLQKAPLIALIDERGWRLCLFFIYTARENVLFQTIYDAVTQCLHHLEKKVPTRYEIPR